MGANPYAQCPDCDHIHTPEGCTGPPSPSDLWAGWSPEGCDCDASRAWPEPYLQPDSQRDCEWYSAAYVARCLGHPCTTVDDVKAWCERTNQHQTRYAASLPDIEGECLRWNFEDEQERRRWWLGPGTRAWVERHLTDGWIADVRIHRVPHMTHAVVLLDASDQGVLLMDPVYGHVVEPWDWFLGIGPGAIGRHRVEYWFRPASPAVAPVPAPTEASRPCAGDPGFCTRHECPGGC